jgi:hypothetical protein
MSLKSAAFFALIGTALLTILVGLGFVRDVAGVASGAVAVLSVVRSGIELLASLSMAVFLYVFHRAQSR